MKKLALVMIILSLSAVSCQLKSRKQSLVPPTSMRDLCQRGVDFYYNTSYDFCLHYPSALWETIQLTDPKSVDETDIVSILFLAPSPAGDIETVFELLVGSNTSEVGKRFQQYNVQTDSAEGSYRIGHRQTANPNVSARTIILKEQVEEVMRSLRVFDPL